jgi:hypothetical protein
MEHWANHTSDSIQDKKKNDRPKKPAKSSSSSKTSNHGLDWLPEPYNYVRGETSLWVAVITQAMMDALSKSSNPETQYHKQ